MALLGVGKQWVGEAGLAGGSKLLRDGVSLGEHSLLPGSSCTPFPMLPGHPEMRGSAAQRFLEDRNL